MPVVLNLDGKHPKCSVPKDVWRIFIDSEGRSKIAGYWDLSYEPGPLQWNLLSGLKELRDLHYSGTDGTVIDYLCSKKCPISTFTWTSHERSRFDFSGSPRLEDLGIDICGSTFHLKLPTNGKFDTLRLLNAPKDCRFTIVSPDRGQSVALTLVGNAIRIPGLKDIIGLNLYDVSHVDLELVSRAYPLLEKLCISGKPVSLTGVESLRKLRHLEDLTILECYSMNASAFPEASSLPMLASVTFDGLRAEDAPVIAERFQAVAEFSLRGKRTNQWLTKNLGNPFRKWDEHFGKATARQAMDAWQKANDAIQCLDGKNRLTQARAALKRFVDAFNKIDRRRPLETDQREQVNEEFHALAVRLAPGTVTDDDYIDWAEFA